MIISGFRRLLLSCIILMLILLTACENAIETVTTHFEKGTNIAYSRCLEKNKGKGISGETIEKLCREKHEEIITNKIDGRAGYQWSSGLCIFSGWITNKSKDKIVTTLNISITHEDNVDSK